MKQATVKKSEKSVVAQQINHRLREGLLLLNMAIALFLLLALVTYHQGDPGWSSTGASEAVSNSGGRAGAWFADFFLYMFGYLAYLFPVLVGYSAWLMYREARLDKEQNYPLIFLKIFGFIVAIVASCGLASIYLTTEQHYLPFTAGGIVGNLVGLSLVSVFNQIGTSILLTALLLGGVTLFTGFSWVKFGRFSAQGFWTSVNICRDKLWQMLKWSKTKIKKPNLSLPKPEAIVATLDKVNPVKLIPSKDKADIIDVEPVAPVVPVAPVPPAKPVKRRFSKRGAKAGKLPSTQLLGMAQQSQRTGYSKAVIEQKSREVEQRLLDFGVSAEVVGVQPGPVITRFELQLAPGVKVSKISGLAKDLARSLSMISVRIVDLIPGKSVVGLELPNESRGMVWLREVLDSEQYQQARSPLSLALGKDIAGHPVIVDLAKMPHLLVAGTTGSGKSVGVNGMLLSMLYKATPEQVRLILVDPKMLELSIYDDIPHLLAPVVTDMKEAANALRWCVGEMERRYRLMASLGVRNLSGYNHKVKEAIDAGEPLPDPFLNPLAEQDGDTLETLPYIVVVIDEFADMMMVVGKKVEQLIARIAQKARAAGIHLVLATQRPSVDVITGLIKANIPTRIAFQVSSKVDSRTIIDQQGAEQLLGHGDMLYLAPGAGVPTRVHGAFVSDDDVHNVVDYIKASGEPDYLTDIVSGNSDAEPIPGYDVGAGTEGEQDEFYDQAVEFVTRTRRASISSVQRQFKIGYNRAARLIEDMERAGVVTPMESNGSREVLAPAPVE